MATTLQNKIYNPLTAALPDAEGWTATGDVSSNTISGDYLKIVDASGVQSSGYKKTITCSNDSPIIVDFELMVESFTVDANKQAGPWVQICTGAYCVEFGYFWDDGPKVGAIFNRAPFSSTTKAFSWDNTESGDYMFHRFRLIIDPKWNQVKLLAAGVLLDEYVLSDFDTTTNKWILWGHDTGPVCTAYWRYFCHNVGIGYIKQEADNTRCEGGNKITLRGDLNAGGQYVMAVDGKTCYVPMTTPNATPVYGRVTAYTPNTISQDRCDIKLNEYGSVTNYVLFEDEHTEYFENYAFNNSRIEIKKHFSTDVYNIGARDFCNVPVVAVQSFVYDPSRFAFVVNAEDFYEKIDLTKRTTPDRVDPAGTPEPMKNVSPNDLFKHCLIVFNGQLLVASVGFTSTTYGEIYLAPEGVSLNFDDMTLAIGDYLDVFYCSDLEVAVYKLTYAEESTGILDLVTHMPEQGKFIETYGFTNVATQFAEQCLVFLNGALLEGDTSVRANCAAVTRDCALYTNKKKILFSTSYTPVMGDWLVLAYLPGSKKGAWVVTAGEEAAQEIPLATHTADRLTHINLTPYAGAGITLYKNMLVVLNGSVEAIDLDERLAIGNVVDDAAKKMSANTLLEKNIAEDDVVFLFEV